jgi:SAM-dependent methyltransferase
MGWKSPQRQRVNFARMIEAVSARIRLRDASVHDAGCGYGNIIPFLRAAGIGQYVGSDCMSDALCRAGARYPKEKFVALDLVSDPLPEVDVTLLVGTLAFHRPQDVLRIVSRAWDASRLGVGMFLWWSLDDSYYMAREAEHARALVMDFIDHHKIDCMLNKPVKMGDDALIVLSR